MPYTITYASQEPYDTVITADTATGALAIAHKLAASYQEIAIETDGDKFSLPEFEDAVASARFGDA